MWLSVASEVLLRSFFVGLGEEIQRTSYLSSFWIIDRWEDRRDHLEVVLLLSVKQSSGRDPSFFSRFAIAEGGRANKKSSLHSEGKLFELPGSS